MTSIISLPSKHLQAVFNVKVPTYLLPPQNEGQLAAAAGGHHNEQAVPEGFQCVFKKTTRAFARSLVALSLMNPSHRPLRCSLALAVRTRNINVCKRKVSLRLHTL